MKLTLFQLSCECWRQNSWHVGPDSQSAKHMVVLLFIGPSDHQKHHHVTATASVKLAPWIEIKAFITITANSKQQPIDNVFKSWRWTKPATGHIHLPQHSEIYFAGLFNEVNSHFMTLQVVWLRSVLMVGTPCAIHMPQETRTFTTVEN